MPSVPLASTPNISQDHDLMRYMMTLTQRYFPKAAEEALPGICSDFQLSDEACTLLKAAIPHVRQRPLPGPAIAMPETVFADAVPSITIVDSNTVRAQLCSESVIGTLHVINPKKRVEGFDEPLVISAYETSRMRECDSFFMEAETGVLQMVCSSVSEIISRGFMIGEIPFGVDDKLNVNKQECDVLQVQSEPRLESQLKFL